MSRRDQFQGVLGRTRAESIPWWPMPPEPPEGAPNVLIVVLDDVGFAQIGCFGSDLDTPNLNALAARGLRYTNFHTTALCSPTRACVLTGRNHHSNGMGRIIDLATGFPGYDCRIPAENGFLSEMLVPEGYAAYAVGKWHLTPEDETHLGATRERWPLGRGFERYYGFFPGETHQFAPSLVHDNHRAPAPRSWEDGYHLTTDLADHAIEFVGDLRAVLPDKRFFLYLATGACHSPHQSPAEWRERYRGRFDAGWDVFRGEIFERQREMGLLPEGTELSARPEWVPAWDSLSSDEQRVHARYMECFAAFLAHADHEIARVLDFLAETGDLDDTLVMVLSDNGASSEGGRDGSINDGRAWNVAGRPVAEAVERIDDIGGPLIHNNYPWGWTIAGNTPFRRWKRETHEGGVADPLIVSWPRRITGGGELRRQYVHAIDLVPTVLEAAGIEAPAVLGGAVQAPIEGTSFAPTFTDGDAADAHVTQYYEMFGCRALYHDGWKAVTYRPIAQVEPPFDEDAWELYHVAVDPSECHDLAADEPDLLRRLVELWWEEAEKHQVLPLDANPFELVFADDRPTIPDRSRYVYWPGGGIPEECAVNIRNRSHTITADVEIVSDDVEGILIAQGSVLGGYALYVQDRRLHYVHNWVSVKEYRTVSAPVVGPGVTSLEMRFTKTKEHAGIVELLVDGWVVGTGEVPHFVPTRFSITGECLYVGSDAGMPVTLDYRPPFRFTGTLHRVTVDVSGEPHVDHAAEGELSIRSQ